MNKLTKLQMEIDKIKQKISEQQTRLRELEQQKTEIENTEIVETLEQVMIKSEKNGAFSTEEINEIFRFMHTIKGSSAMMMFNEISSLSQTVCPWILQP